MDWQAFIFERVNAVNTTIAALRHPAHVAHLVFLLKFIQKNGER